MIVRRARQFLYDRLAGNDSVLFVAPEARGTGAGCALMERAEAHARETGAGGLDLMTQKTNTTAQRLYESCGWVRDQEFYHYERPLPPDDPSPRSR